MIMEIEVRTGNKERVHENAKRLVNYVKGIQMDIESGGLLYDLLMGCGITTEEFHDLTKND